VSFHVQDSVESLFGDVDLDVDAVGQTADLQIGWWEVCLESGRYIASDLRISGVFALALTDPDVVAGIAEGVSTTLLVEARILAGLGFGTAIFVVGALIVGFAFRSGWRNAVAVAVESVIEFCRTDAIASFVDDQSFLQSADTAATLVDFEAFLFRTRYAFVVVVQSGPGWADALTVGSRYEALVGPTRHFVALNRRVSLIAW
jgi:hypothetical protein